MSNDSQEFCGVLAGRLSQVMLPHNQEMPSEDIIRVIDEHLADSGNVGTLLMQLEDEIVRLRAALAAAHSMASRYLIGHNLLNDLDRNEHGRHFGDADAMDPTGISQGNPWMQDGQRIGTTLFGDPIVMRHGEQRVGRVTADITAALEGES